MFTVRDDQETFHVGKLAEISFLLNAQWVAKLAFLSIPSHPSSLPLGQVSLGRLPGSVSPVYQLGT